MKDRKKPTGPPRFPDMPFDEALARLLQTDPKELTDAFEENRKRVEDIRRSASQRREHLRAATRGS
jgi:hypothetical protein